MIWGNEFTSKTQDCRLVTCTRAGEGGEDSFPCYINSLVSDFYEKNCLAWRNINATFARREYSAKINHCKKWNRSFGLAVTWVSSAIFRSAITFTVITDRCVKCDMTFTNPRESNLTSRQKVSSYLKIEIKYDSWMGAVSMLSQVEIKWHFYINAKQLCHTTTQCINF